MQENRRNGVIIFDGLGVFLGIIFILLAAVLLVVSVIVVALQ